MPKTPLPLHSNDMTVFVRALSKQLGDAGPSHLALMNMVARAAGYQNLQHMRSANAAATRLGRAGDDQPADARAVERALHQFDDAGRLIRWPSKRSVQTLVLWALWARLPAGRSLAERAVNDRLGDEHLFADPAILRRTMIACRLVSRRADGTDYRRIEREPPAEAKALIKAVTLRRRTRREHPGVAATSGT